MNTLNQRTPLVGGNIEVKDVEACGPMARAGVEMVAEVVEGDLGSYPKNKAFRESRL